MGLHIPSLFLVPLLVVVMNLGSNHQDDLHEYKLNFLKTAKVKISPRSKSEITLTMSQHSPSLPGARMSQPGSSAVIITVLCVEAGVTGAGVRSSVQAATLCTAQTGPSGATTSASQTPKSRSPQHAHVTDRTATSRAAHSSHILIQRVVT